MSTITDLAAPPSGVAGSEPIGPARDENTVADNHDRHHNDDEDCGWYVSSGWPCLIPYFPPLGPYPFPW